ncbi:MAG: hypothetical protein COX46_03410, partial [bacterium (Candidatus Ratteibacteria) CG23_combo_of_CG06-09_8_20_14_all_48_7]
LAGEKKSGDESILELRQDISLLNLANDLYLTKEQIESLLPIINEATAIRESAKQAILELQPATEKAFKNLKTELEKNQETPAEVKERASGLNHQIKQIQEDTGERLVALEKKVEETLTEQQRCLIDDFVPCLIPPQKTTNPTRIGQAKDDTSAQENMLTKVRKLSPQEYARHKEKILQRLRDLFEEKVFVLYPEEEEAFRSRVLEVFDRARSLSESDFQVQKKSLAEEMSIGKLSKQGRRRKGEPGAVGRYFLNKNMAEILKTRLKSL